MDTSEIKKILHQFVLLNSIKNNTNTNELHRLHLTNSEISKMIDREIKNNTIIFKNNGLILTPEGQNILKKHDATLKEYFKIDNNFSEPLYSYFFIENEDNDFFIPDDNKF